MTPTIRHVLVFFLQFGSLGLFLLGIADDSFLFLPVGVDLLMVILVARHPGQFAFYVAAAMTAVKGNGGGARQLTISGTAALWLIFFFR